MYIVEYKLEQNLRCRELYNYLKESYGSHPKVAKLVARAGI